MATGFPYLLQHFPYRTGVVDERFLRAALYALGRDESVEQRVIGNGVYGEWRRVFFNPKPGKERFECFFQCLQLEIVEDRGPLPA